MVVLSLTFATPAFAWGPPDNEPGAGSLPEKSEFGLSCGKWAKSLPCMLGPDPTWETGWGWSGMLNGGGIAWGPARALGVLNYLLDLLP